MCVPVWVLIVILPTFTDPLSSFLHASSNENSVSPGQTGTPRFRGWEMSIRVTYLTFLGLVLFLFPLRPFPVFLVRRADRV
jgi:hypothetical protein